MQEYGDREAVVHQDRIFSYHDMLDLRRQWLDLFRQQHLTPGTVVSMVGDFSASSCAAFLALMENRNIIVPLMPNAYVTHPEFLDIAEVQHILKPDLGMEIIHQDREIRHTLLRQLASQNEPGLVLFSSGSTGKSKAALHSLTSLVQKFTVRRPSLRTMIFLLFDHIGGINTLFYIFSNGGVMIAPGDRTPTAICQTVEETRVELLPVSPTFLNLLLLSGEYKDYDLSSLKKITYGTEPMPQSTLDKMAREFPDVALQQTYGLSELGILRSKSRSNTSLWVRVGGEGYQTKIVDNTLWIKAESSMLGYLNAPSPFDDEGWFNTQDMVEVDGEFVRFLGRDSEIINVGGEKVYPAEVESQVLQLDNIQDVTVHGESNPLSGQIVVARVNLISPEPLTALKKRIRIALRDKLPSFKIPQKVVLTDMQQFNERFKRMRSAP